VVAKRLAKAGAGLRIHVIAFDLTAAEAESLRCVADSTGGAFLPTRDARSLSQALKIAVEEVIEPTLTPPSPVPAPKVEPDATLEALSSVSGGWPFEVKWRGPNGPNDYVTIVPVGSPDSFFDNYSYTANGSPLELIAAVAPGEYELRYVVARSREVLARRPIVVHESGVILSAPDSVLIGATIKVAWVAPADRGDFITIVPSGAKPESHTSYEHPHGLKGPVSLRAPGVPGSYEIRYVSRQGGRILATIPILVTAPGASLAVPGQVVAGFRFEVQWTGPGRPGDYITIVTPDAKKRSYRDFVYTYDLKAPAELRAPRQPGLYEVRYAMGGAHDVLGSTLLEVSAPITSSSRDSARGGRE